MCARTARFRHGVRLQGRGSGQGFDLGRCAVLPLRSRARLTTKLFPKETRLHDHKWDERFMLLAHHLATWSIEKGRRVGAVIVGPDHEIRSTGFNGLPRGVRDDLEERHSRITGAKYIWSCHAEQNAIFNAARVGVALKGCSIYVPWFPCVECTKAIIQSGITELVAYAPDRPNSNWAEDFSIADMMLKESGINVRLIPRLAELPDASEDDG